MLRGCLWCKFLSQQLLWCKDYNDYNLQGLPCLFQGAASLGLQGFAWGRGALNYWHLGIRRVVHFPQLQALQPDLREALLDKEFITDSITVQQVVQPPTPLSPVKIV